jgi:dipeptidyl aminopeptidase/acylaminoacyl peptidase
MSPITHVKADVPPVLTIHGNADPQVSHAQSERLHEALNSFKVQNRLFTFTGTGHGAQSMTAEQLIAAYDAIASFLREYRVLR